MELEVHCPECEEFIEVELESSKILEMDGDRFIVPFTCDCGAKGKIKVELSWD